MFLGAKVELNWLQPLAPTASRVSIQAAGVIAGQRSALIGRVLPCLLALADASSGSAVRSP